MVREELFKVVRISLMLAEPGYYEDGSFGIRIESLFPHCSNGSTLANPCRHHHGQGG